MLAHHCSGSEAENFDFGPFADGLFRPIQELARDFRGEDVFSTVLTDLTGDVLEDDKGFSALEHDRHPAQPGLALLAEETSHEVLLVLKSGSQRSGFGAYTVTR